MKMALLVAFCVLVVSVRIASAELVADVCLSPSSAEAWQWEPQNADKENVDIRKCRTKKSSHIDVGNPHEYPICVVVRDNKKTPNPGEIYIEPGGVFSWQADFSPVKWKVHAYRMKGKNCWE